EHVSVIDLTCAGLVPSGNIADVKVADCSQVAADGINQIPFHDLNVIQIEKDFHERAGDFAHDLERLQRVVQIVIGVVVLWVQRLDLSQRVQHFDDQCNPVRGNDVV